MELPVPPVRTTWQHRMRTPAEVRAYKRKGRNGSRDPGANVESKITQGTRIRAAEGVPPVLGNPAIAVSSVATVVAPSTIPIPPSTYVHKSNAVRKNAGRQTGRQDTRAYRPDQSQTPSSSSSSTPHAQVKRASLKRPPGPGRRIIQIVVIGAGAREADTEAKKKEKKG
ncbi:hypothetical protein BJ912DRAFT_1045104 [Pholiota molesta]|nr:hypothetical protein BJ912DRAFT_1045104 [Pholiota molesta]